MSQEQIRMSRNLRGQNIHVSFEFFPPKSEKMEARLWQAIGRLAPLSPHFMSVTYGAGGSTRERTHATVSRLIKETYVKPAAHLKCVGASKAEVNEVIQDYWDIGVRHIVALRGDPPEGIDQKFTPHPDGYASSVELIKGIKAIGDFKVFVSAYPETHPESPSLEAEIDWLKAKVDAGADRAITQFFFDNDHYMRYMDKVLAANITIPITPGIIPIANFKQVSKFAQMAGASIPGWLADRFEGLEDDSETARFVAAAVVAEQVMELVDNGVKEFHFYTLNRANLVFAICSMLGLHPVGIKMESA